MKKFAAIFLTAALCLTLAACAGEAPENPPAPPEPPASAEPAPVSQPLPVEEPAPEPVWTVSDGITVSLLQDAYPEGTAKLTVILDNASELDLGYSGGFSCEKYADGTWQRLDFSEPVFIADVLYTVQPHSAVTTALDMDLLAEPLEEGLYRITGSSLWIGEDEKAPSWQVSFRVTADAQPEPDYALYIPGQMLPTVQGCGVTDRIPVLFINTTGEGGLLLDIPHLEKLGETGEWSEVPYKDNIGFCGTPDPLPAKGRNWSEEIPTLWGTLEDGRYRLSYAVGPNSDTDQTVYSEFTLYTPEDNQGLPLAE